MIKLIIFDFDGVIVTGSNDGYFTCYHKALEDVGVSLSSEEERKRIRAHWGKGHRQQLVYLLEEHSELVDSAVKAYEHYYHDTNLFFSKIRLIDGAKQALDSLAKHYTLALATGMMRVSLEHFLEKFQLTDYFQYVISIDDLPDLNDRKPSGYIVDAIRKQTDISSEETICVGDSENDILMAQNARVTPVAVLSGNMNKRDAEAVGVKYIIDDVTQLETILAEIIA